MSKDEMEKLEITEYDLDNEFNPTITGGVQQAGKKDNKTKDNNNVVKKEDDSDDGQPTTSFKTRNSSDESEEERPARAGFGTEKPKKYTQSTVTEISGDIADLRRKNTLNPALINQGVGNWNKHTKGIEAKLLLQMGFKPGKGLGKDLQGISAPVEATLRKGRGGIGAYGPEKPASIPKPKS